MRRTMIWRGLIGLIVVGLGSVTLSRAVTSETMSAISASTLTSPATAFLPTQPVTGHPRLWIRAEDLPRLRSWAADSNPVYRDGLAFLAAQAKADMDAGHLPAEDDGSPGWHQYPNEKYAALFAFLSLISPDSAARDDYARRARTLLMYVMNEAAKGAADAQPFRDPTFAIFNRSRWWGESYALTVDWIYPYLSAADKATIRQVFLRWVAENQQAEVTTYNHPEPMGIVNDPVLVSDRDRVRWSGNNYFTAHMRNIGLIALALDPADDPGNRLRDNLGSATGAWLYMVDHLMRTDIRGGLAAEGFDYSPQAMGYVAQFLLALYTAGEADPAARGPQVVLSGNPFWNEVAPAFLHSISPSGHVSTDPNYEWMGPLYQAANYGDVQRYWVADFVGVFGPLGLYDSLTGNSERLQVLRWIVKHTSPGGADAWLNRVGNTDAFLDAMLYFMLFDPAAPEPSDPRPTQPLTWYAPGLGRILARTSWGPEATWFTYKLGWNRVDHQHGDGNLFEFYRRGEWLTKERSGYGENIGSSDYKNTLALQNDPPDHNAPGEYRNINWLRGSQWFYVSQSDGQILAHSIQPSFVYALGDATALYNSIYELSTDILHASRSIVWLKPDHILVYDRAASKTAGRFKRFWLNLPANATVVGQRTTMALPSGQQLFVTTLLPADAAITVEAAEPLDANAEPAELDPIRYRLRVEAPGGPSTVRFLHVLQGADAGASPNAVALIQSDSGVPYAGAVVKDTAVLFPVDVDTAFTGMTYTAPGNTRVHLVTGLSPNAGYDVISQIVGSNLQVTIRPGTAYAADAGGVLALGTAATLTPTRTLTPPPGATTVVPPTPTRTATPTPPGVVTATPSASTYRIYLPHMSNRRQHP